MYPAASGLKTNSGSWSEGDFDGDGNVLFADFLTLAENFGQGASNVTADPGAELWLNVLYRIGGDQSFRIRKTHVE